MFPQPVPAEAFPANAVVQLVSGQSISQTPSPTPATPQAVSGLHLYGSRINGLDRLLAPGERIACISGGVMKTHIAGADTVRSAVCVATDRRCIFYNRRMLGRYDFEDFAYDRITSVQVRKGLAWSAIDIYVAQVKKELYLTNNDCVEVLGNFIREKIHYRTPLVEAPVTQAVSDVPSQIRQLAELLQQGHITQQEFDAMKQELMRSIRPI